MIEHDWEKIDSVVSQYSANLNTSTAALTPTGRSSFAGPGVMTLEKLAPLNSF